MRKLNFTNLLLILSVSLSCNASHAENSKYSKIRALINADKNQEAFLLASTVFQEDAGQLDFDLLYGRAALNSGHYSEAAFAFQRVLQVQPSNAEAHMQLAQARYKQDKLTLAQSQALLVLKSNPSPVMRANVDSFLDQIEYRRVNLALSPPRTTAMQVRLNTGVGYDSNINSSAAATVLSDLFIPPQTGITSAPATSSPIGSGYSSFGGIIDLIQPINYFDFFQNKLTYFATVYANYNLNYRTQQYNLGNYFFNNGLIYRDDRNIFKLPARFQELTIQKSSVPLLEAFFIAPEYDRLITPRHSLGAAVEFGVLRYPQVKSLNQNQVLGTLIWQYLNLDNRVNTEVDIFGGDAPTTRPQYNYNSSAFTGYRLYGEWGFLPGHSLYANFTQRFSWYASKNPMFNVVNRVEHYNQFVVGWNWTFHPNWTLQPYYSFSQNVSDIQVFNFNRNVVGVAIEFRFDSFEVKEMNARRKAEAAEKLGGGQLL